MRVRARAFVHECVINRIFDQYLFSLQHSEQNAVVKKKKILQMCYENDMDRLIYFYFNIHRSKHNPTVYGIVCLFYCHILG